MECTLQDLSAEAQKIVAKICREENLTDYNLTVSSGSSKGDGYASKLFRVKIESIHQREEKKKKNKSKTELNVMLKIAPAGESIREKFCLEELFEREFYMYNVVLPELDKLQRELAVPEEERFSNYCKFYGGSIKATEEVIALENLKERGFELWDRRVPMSYEAVRMVLRCFGKYHALSFALRAKEPELFAKLSGDLSDLSVPLMKDYGFTPMVTNNVIQAAKSLDPEKDRAAVKKFRKIEEEGFDYLEKVTEDACKSAYVVLGHGDSWCNNLMFRFSECGKPTDLKLLDWQISRSASPVLDLSYFLMPNLRLVRDKANDLLLEYHECLSNFLRLLQCDPEKLYPLETFQNEWKNFSSFGLMWSLCLGYVMTVEKEDVKDLMEMAETGEDPNEAFTVNSEALNVDAFNDIVRNAILYCADNECI